MGAGRHQCHQSKSHLTSWHGVEEPVAISAAAEAALRAKFPDPLTWRFGNGDRRPPPPPSWQPRSFLFPNGSEFQARFCILNFYSKLHTINHSFLLFCICGQFIINLNRKYRFRLTDWLIDSSKNSQLIKSLPDLGRHLWTARHYPVRFDWDNSTVAQRYDGPTVAGWF